MKNVIITGASRGIGRALAEKFLAEGFFVIGTSTTGASELQHSNLVMLQLDLGDSKSIENCAKRIIDLGKKIDILINNAGVWLEGDYQEKIDISVLRKILDINLIGPIDVTERLLSLINKGGHILNVSSRRGSLDYNNTDSNYPDYSISKAALNMFSKTLAHRLQGNVTVSAVHPGYVRTDMNEGGGDVTAEEAAAHIYELAVSNVETGQFWYEGKKYPW